ncbi:hypothetical protein [Pontibacter sp. HSC-36F09]|uniref:hypothetical protein n=1 Tax=Pontibacter sp. HSC-36F09 TaxID=2910966 RepID=UPI00209D5C76|nr:hypothetical protein [Pontibacter sp. HSC-36F09]MCP2045716.1 hypothetical protein [Pontibacter sp. HSC-36F09]
MDSPLPATEAKEVELSSIDKSFPKATLALTEPGKFFSEEEWDAITVPLPILSALFRKADLNSLISEICSRDDAEPELLSFS